MNIMTCYNYYDDEDFEDFVSEIWNFYLNLNNKKNSLEKCSRTM